QALPVDLRSPDEVVLVVIVGAKDFTRGTVEVSEDPIEVNVDFQLGLQSIGCFLSLSQSVQRSMRASRACFRASSSVRSFASYCARTTSHIGTPWACASVSSFSAFTLPIPGQPL